MSASRKRVVRELSERGLLLVTDAVLPSLVGLVSGEPVRGSWWAHPKAHEIYGILESLEEDDALVVKLVSSKQTLVHRSLWPELLAIATSHEAWQTKGLDSKAEALWKIVQRQGSVRLDSLSESEGDRKGLSKRVRELETRLLVYGSHVHTKSGAHQKLLSSWTHVAETFGVRFERVDVEAAKRDFEARTEGRLPWFRGVVR